MFDRHNRPATFGWWLKGIVRLFYYDCEVFLVLVPWILIYSGNYVAELINDSILVECTLYRTEIVHRHETIMMTLGWLCPLNWRIGVDGLSWCMLVRDVWRWRRIESRWCYRRRLRRRWRWSMCRCLLFATEETHTAIILSRHRELLRWKVLIR